MLENFLLCISIKNLYKLLNLEDNITGSERRNLWSSAGRQVVRSCFLPFILKHTTNILALHIIYKAYQCTQKYPNLKFDNPCVAKLLNNLEAIHCILHFHSKGEFCKILLIYCMSTWVVNEFLSGYISP